MCVRQYANAKPTSLQLRLQNPKQLFYIYLKILIVNTNYTVQSIIVLMFLLYNIVYTLNIFKIINTTNK